ncbi:MAG: flippase-like domain-containing protein [Anaerolineales bacterium]|nr:flippase-like domain-containing protein [Anaerolineales bacterium]
MNSKKPSNTDDKTEKREYLTAVLHAAILIGMGIAAVKYLNGEEVVQAFATFNFRLAPFILLLSLFFLLLKGVRFALLMEPFRGDLPWVTTFKAYVAGQAATLLPGGIAARAGLMKQVNVPVAKSSVAIAFSSMIDQLYFVLGSLTAVLWFEAARTAALAALGVVTAVTLILIIPASRRQLLRAADWLAEKFHIQDKWHTFVQAVPQVFTWRIMGFSLAITLLAFAAEVIALDLATRGVGLQLSYPTVLLGFFLPTMLGRILPVPGGVGVTEVSMVGFLAATSDADPNQLAAAVAIFRVGAIFFQALVGAVVYFTLWKGKEEAADRGEIKSLKNDLKETA